jgi:hypothetical protein
MNFSLKGQSKVGTCVGLFMMMLLLVSITTFSTPDTAEAGGSGSGSGGSGGGGFGGFGSSNKPSPGASQSSDKSPSPGASKSSDKSPSQSSGNTTTQAGQQGLSNGRTVTNKATGRNHSLHGTAAEARVAGRAVAAVTGGTVKVFEVQSAVTGLTVGHIAVTTPRTGNTSNNNNNNNNDRNNDNDNNRNNNANSNTAAPIATDANSNTAAPTTVSWDTDASYSMDCTVTGAGIEPIIFNPSTNGPTGSVTTGVLTSTGLYELRCTEPNSGLVFIETFSIEVVGSVQEI